MTATPPKMILLNPEHKEIHAAVGAAVDHYAHMEGSQSMVLESILGAPIAMASVIFFSVQNVRARHEMFASLLSIKYGDKYKKFWGQCEKFLFALSLFRNAIVHWQPCVTRYQSKSGVVVKHEHELTHPTSLVFIKTADIQNFINDCRYIEQEILALNSDLNGKPPAPALPDRFLKPTIRRNLAVLQQLQKPKAQQPQRPPSRPSALRKGRKLSVKQRRMRALNAAKAKKV